MKAADFAIRHPAIIGILLISLAFFGVLSFRGMKRDLLANITTPEILVMTVYPGASPEVVERDVTDILEEEFSLIAGIERISSSSNNGYSLVFLTMSWEVDLDAGKNDIRDRISNAASRLPEGIDGSPRLYDLGTSSLPVYTCAVESDLPAAELARILEDDIVPRMSRIQDVSAVYARGAEVPAIRVRLNPAILESVDVTALEVYAAISRGQATVPAGEVTVGADRLAFQSEGDFRSMASIRRQPVGYTPDGRPVYVDDVAEVVAGFENPEFRAFSGPLRTVALDVMKRSGGDTDGIVRSLTELQDFISAENGGRIRFRTVLDDAGTIGITLSSVGRSAWLGGLLAVAVLLLFLHDLRAALIVTLAIPFTVFLTFILMRARGLTLNIMTLAGMTVSIGMIVDASIVMLENTLRHRRMGEGTIESASRGADEVGGAVLASTSTSVSVFLPLFFVSGLAGAILSEVSWVLLFALASSALTALILVPWLSSRILVQDLRPGFLAAFGKAFDAGFDRFSGIYRKFLRGILDRKIFVGLLSVVLVAASVTVIAGLGGEMFSAPDMNEIELSVRMPAAYSLGDAEVKMNEIAAEVRREVPEIETDLWYAGLADAATIVDRGNPSAGYGRIRLIRAARRDRSVFDIVRHLNSRLNQTIVDADITVKNGGLAKQMDYATDGGGFRVEISGAEWEVVLNASEILRRIMESDPLVERTRIGVRLDEELMAVELDPEDTGRLGVDPRTAGTNLRILFAGESAGNLDADGEIRPIVVDSTLAEGRLSPGILGRLRVRNAAGYTVPYSAFADLKRRGGTDTILHRDRLPSLVITADLRENDLSGIRHRLEPVFRETLLPPGVTWRVVGAAEVMGETFRDLSRALLIAVFLVYAVMVIQFERFVQPFIIMVSVPFVLIGVALSMAGFGTRLTMMTFFGVIALGGMVVNNAIVLVTFANQRRADGSGVRDAILDAARIRLKPILMTTLTTLLGLIPLAFSLDEGSEIYAPLGQVIGGGLLTSTLISLALVPVLYEVLEQRRGRPRKPRRKARAAPTASPGTSAPEVRKSGGGYFRGPGSLSVLVLISAGVLVASGAAPVSLGAEDAPVAGGRRFWTPEDLVERTLRDDPGLQASRQEAREAVFRLQAARSERGPVLDLELGATYLSDPVLSVSPGDLGEFPDSLGPPLGGLQLPAEDIDVFGTANELRYDLAVTLEQPLFTWGKISSGIRLAEAGSAASAWNARAREVDAATEVLISAESLAVVGQMVKIARRQETLGRRLVELSRENADEGFLPESDYRDVRNRLRQLTLTVSSLERRSKDLLLILRSRTGLDHLEIESLELPDPKDLADSLFLPDPEVLIESAGRNNPDLRALGAMRAAAESELELVRAGASAKPDVAFRAEFGYGGRFAAAPDDVNGNWRLTVGAETTLFDSGRVRRQIGGAEAALAAAAARVENLRRQTEMFIRSSLIAMENHRENISYYSGLRDSALQRSQDRRRSWEEGYGPEQEWILAEIDQLSAENRRLGEVLALIGLDRQIRAACGREL